MMGTKFFMTIIPSGNEMKMDGVTCTAQGADRLRLGRGHPARSPRDHNLLRQIWGRAGEPPKISAPRRKSTSQRAVFEWGRSPCADGTRLPTFFRGAEARPDASSSREEKRTDRDGDAEHRRRGKKGG